MNDYARYTELMHIMATQAYRDARERAVRFVDAVWEPNDGVVPDKWYRDTRVETVALLLYFGILDQRGSNSPPGSDPQVAALQARIDAAKRALG